MIDLTRLNSDITDLDARFQNATDAIKNLLPKTFDLELFIHDIDALSHELKLPGLSRSRLIDILTTEENLSATDASEVIDSVANFISYEQIKIKLERELNGLQSFILRRVNNEPRTYEKWQPLGVLVQILSGNDLALPILSAFEGLITGNINLIRLSRKSSRLTEQFFNLFKSFKSTQKWSDRIHFFSIASDDKTNFKKLLSLADGVVAWGGEEALSEIKQMSPSGARFIDWGHRISFAYFSESTWKKNNNYDLLVKDVCIFNQQSCSSPQVAYFEGASFKDLIQIGKMIEHSFIKTSDQFRWIEPDLSEWAEINKNERILIAERSIKAGFTDLISHAKFRLWIDSRTALRASPLYRTLWIKPIDRNQIVEALRPMKNYLQTVGLDCEKNELADIYNKLLASGASRVRPIGEMQDGYMGEPHDGHRALIRYVKRVSSALSENNSFGLATIDELQRYDVGVETSDLKVLDKYDFQSIPELPSTKLYFKSGGSSGEPKISQFTYSDYHLQMQAAADGLIAAGFEPLKDKAMNLFFGGGLYGGFISFFTILEKLEAIQFPMSAHLDFDFVGQIIIKYNINTLLGMPSYLMQVLSHNKSKLTHSKTLKKIFYGGEAFTDGQIEELKNEYGIEWIRSASYGSVDMGPLGHQCTHSMGRLYHLNQRLHKLEILSMTSNEPALPNQLGRLVFSTVTREHQNLLRYDVGDIGREVVEPCPCGRTSKRFELVGRSGDFFRSAGCFLNYGNLVHFFKDEFGLSFEFQIILDRNPNRETLTFVFGVDAADQEWWPILKNHRIYSFQDLVSQICLRNRDINELVIDERTLDLDIKLVPKDLLDRSVASGKLVHVLDKRS